MKLGNYKHFKGKVYEVIGLAKHTETEEELVIYRDEEKHYWARPKEMFFENVEKENYSGPRFTFLEEIKF